MKTDIWQHVIRAIEAAIPQYDAVNEKISLGKALKARNYAVDKLELKQGMMALDAGIGPGTMSEILLSESAGLTLIGLDASTLLLHAARERLQPFCERVQLVRGTFEALPFKDKCFHRIVSAFAFRDSRDRSTAIDEFYRVCSDNGAFAIVDLGKPDSFLKQFIVATYVRYLMPLIAWWSKSDVIRGNPWRMIIATYEALGSNRGLVKSLRSCFADVKITEWGLGGLVIIIARRMSG